MVAAVLLGPTVLSDQGTKAAEPVIISISPDSGPPGTRVTLSGVGFAGSPSENVVRIGPLRAVILSASSSQLAFSVPRGLTPGEALVTVSTAGQTSGPATFRVFEIPGDRPAMRIRRDNPGDFNLSWFAASVDFELEAAPSLDPPVRWAPVPLNPAVSGDLRSVNVPGAESSRRFYRLKSALSSNAAVNTLTGLLRLPDDWAPAFRILDSVEANISAAAGGTVRLANGGSIEFKPGAVGADTGVKVMQLDLSEFNHGIPRDVYRVEMDDGQLLLPAIVALPLPAPSTEGAPGPIRVFRSSPEGGTEEMAFTTDDAAGMVRFDVNHFSDLFVQRESAAGVEFGNGTRVTRISGPKILPVPFYPQGNTYWCFAASSQMMLKYHGVDLEAWDVGRYFGLGLNDGPSPWRLYSGGYQGLYENAGLKVGDRSAWVSSDSINAFLLDQIDAGQPVFIIVQYGLHALVVVGYDRGGVYIHDPSGHSIQVATGQTRDPSHMASYFVAWEQWNAVMFSKTIGVTFNAPLPVWTVVLDSPSKPATPVTATILSAIQLEDGVAPNSFFEVRRPDPPRNPDVSEFLWDGEEALGYAFVPGPTFKPSNLANTDDFTLSLHLNNSGPLAEPVSLRAKIDDRLIFDTPSPITVPAKTSLSEFPMFPENQPFRFKEMPGGLLKPGLHDLLIEVYRDATVLDRIPLQFQIGPSKPTGLTKTPSSGGVTLRWASNPESPGSVLDYEISDGFTTRFVGPATSFFIAAGDGGNIEFDYRVAARDVESGLKSPLSDRAVRSELVLVRQDPPLVEVFGELLSGERLEPSEVFGGSETSAFIAAGAYPLRLTWTVPPAELNPGDKHTIVVHEDSGGAPSAVRYSSKYDISTPAGLYPSRISGGVKVFAVGSSLFQQTGSDASVGYNSLPVSECPRDLIQSVCFELSEAANQAEFTATGNEMTVVMTASGYGRLAEGKSGFSTVKVTWKYVKAPAPNN